MSHRVRKHHYVNGQLNWEDKVFADFVSAIEFAKSLDCHSVKIYNDQNVCVYTIQLTTENELYA